jgi:hypothetical protein
MRLLVVLAVALSAGLPLAHADAQRRGRALTDLQSLHRACRGAQDDGPLRLYSVVVEPADYSFSAYDGDESVLWVDSRTSLRAMGGAVQLLPTGLESVGFTTSAERATLLRAARGHGAKLRIGFFIGFDGRGGTLCLLRPAAGVTTARIDLAYVELLDTDGSVLAREDFERLRAFLDDPERRRIPGDGPRGLLGESRAVRGARGVPGEWQTSLAEPGANVATGLTRCYTAALSRGAAREGQVIVRVDVDATTGRVGSAEVELATIEDAEGAACVAGVLKRALVLPPAGSGTVELRIPVRLVAD